MALTDADVQRVPVDSFAVRLAIIRAAMRGLNIRAAAELCNISPENWRRWEKGHQPQNQEAAARKISAATGFDFRWIMAGGPLAEGGAQWKSESRWTSQQPLFDSELHPLFELSRPLQVVRHSPLRDVA